MESPGDQQGRAVIKEFNHKELKGAKFFNQKERCVHS